MKRYAVIGLGRFGSRLAVNLAAARQEVVAIDIEPRIVEELRDQVTLAVALDATDEEALRLQGIDKVDVAVVGISSNFEVCTLATVILKDLGVKRVIARAVTTTGAEILRRIGADQVVNPEDEAADRWGFRLTSPNFLSQTELEPGYSIVEVHTPGNWVGKTLVALELRRKHEMNVVAIKRADASAGEGEANFQLPRPSDVLAEGDVLVVMGPDDRLAKLSD